MNIVNKKIEELKPYEKNPRNNEDAVKYVANSIKEFGFKVPIVITKDGTIVTGHTRYKACQELGMKEIPCVIADDLTEEQIKAFRIADNKVGEVAFWNNDILAEEIKDLNFDMTDFGFGDFELNILMGDFEPEEYDDELIEEYSSKSDENLANKRIIITYRTEEEEEYLSKVLNVEKLQVVYKAEDLIKNASNSD